MTFPGYIQTMQELKYEIKEDIRIGKKLTSIISLN